MVTIIVFPLLGWNIRTELKSEIEQTHIARLTCLISTFRVSGSIGMVWTLIPMYAAPLSKAACPDEGTILYKMY
jgi:hypothetical protein